MSYQRLPPPQSGFIEQVYAHDVVGDAHEQVTVAGAYALGLEASTHDVGGDAAARADGTMIWLAPGQSRTYHTTITVLDGAAAVADTVQVIESCQRQPAADVPG